MQGSATLEAGLCRYHPAEVGAVRPECPPLSATDGAAPSPENDRDSSNRLAYVIFSLASVFAGLGNSPLNTVGMTYIDENVSKQDSAFYMGIPMSMFAVGPVLGFFFHAYVMQFHADVFPPQVLPALDDGVNKTTVEMKTTTASRDPDFVGAWWISYLIVGCMISFLAGLALFFPRKLATTRDKRKQEGEEKITATSDKGNDYRSKKKEEEEGEQEVNDSRYGMAMIKREKGINGNGHLPSDENKKTVAVSVKKSSVSSSPSLWFHIKSLLMALFDLLANPVYLSTLVGSACFSTGRSVGFDVLNI